MTRRLLIIPFVATQLCAQLLPTPSAAQTALRERAQQFYQLQLDKKFRQSEAFVADDTKDLYYSAKKGDLQSFSIQKVEVEPGEQKGKVTVKTKISVMMMGAATGRMPIETSSVTLWKIENGLWSWYMVPEKSRSTPFGAMTSGPDQPAAIPGLPDPEKLKKPDIAAMVKQVTIDKTAVLLTEAEPEAVVTLTNGMPGSVEVFLGDPYYVSGVTATIDKTALNPGEKALLRIRREPKASGNGIVKMEVVPWHITFTVQIAVK